MFRGSPDLSSAQLANINAAMGGRFNADTQQTVTQYFSTVPAEYLDVALRIEAIRMSGILDTQELWQQERGAIEQEVASDLSSPEYVFYTKLLAAMFKGTPYAWDALGTKESFDATTGAMLKNFHDTWYAPNNAIIVVAGDVTPEKVIAQIKTLFGPIPSKKLPARPAIELGPVEPQTIQMANDLPYSMAILSFRLPGYDSPDYAACQVLADVLDSQRGKFADLAAEGKVLSAGFDLNVLPKAGLGFVTASFPQSIKPETVIDELWTILRQEQTDGFDADIVAAAKRRETADVEYQKNSVTGLAMAWSQALAIEGRPSPQADVDAISRVSVDDVNRVARLYLHPNLCITAIFTPQASGTPVMGTGRRGAESVNMPQSPETTLPSWADEALKRLSIPAAQLNPFQRQLPNGITLIVQPTTVSRTVSIYGRVKSKPGLQVPPGQEGVDKVLNGLFDYGTQTLNRQAFQKALDDIAANASVGTDFSLEVLKDQFDPGTRLLADNLLHPALPEEAFAIVRDQTAAVAAGDEHSPAELAHRALKKGLYPEKDPALRWPTPKEVSALSLADVRAYYQKIMRPDETVMVVIGDVTAEEAEATVSKYFGAWQATGPKPDLLMPRVPANAPVVVHVPNKSRIQDNVVLAQTLGLTLSDPDYYAIKLGNHVLGGGFYATRLYHDLREERGLVYSVDVEAHADQRRAVYAVEYACDPANVEIARTIVTRNIETMQTQPVNAGELDLAKAMLLREIPLDESSLGAIARGYIGRIEVEQPLDEPVLAARRYVALTAAQVQAAFAKWLRPQDWVQVTEGPAPE